MVQLKDMHKNGFLKSFDGTRIFYSIDENPEAKAAPLLFCYGLVCSELHWKYQMEYFKKSHTVIWSDYRGHQRSDLPSDLSALNIENMAKDIEFLLDELKIPEVTVLGHSMGVNVVLELYKLIPHRIKAMVLANGSGRGPLENLFRSNIMQYVVPQVFGFYRKHPKLANWIWRAQGKLKLTSKLVGKLGFNPSLAKAEDIETYVRMVTQMDLIVTLHLLSEYDNYDATAWLHTINVPTLIIAGENDIIIPRESQEVMHQLIPKSQFELVRNGSHCPQMDIPELVNIMIERFLGSIPQS